MSRIAYVNGRYLPLARAKVHVEDRGYQFADGIYEVIAIHDGNLIDELPHLQRLRRSLDELRIAMPVSEAALRHIMAEIVARNRVVDGALYMQITRGVAKREHAFPSGVKPALVVMARAKPRPPTAMSQGVAVITTPDIRWKRCDIKSVSLLPNILGKQQAREAGAYEAWQVDERGQVTEGTSSNAWIVTKTGELVTRSADAAILNGITRLAVIALAEAAQLRVVERGFTVAEAREAREAFLTSTSSWVTPIVRIDAAMIGDGKPGVFAQRLRQYYVDYMHGHDARPA